MSRSPAVPPKGERDNLPRIDQARETLNRQKSVDFLEQWPQLGDDVEITILLSLTGLNFKYDGDHQAPLHSTSLSTGIWVNATAAKTEEMTGISIQRLYADKGYRGHDYDGKAKVMISGNKRGLTPTMKRELKRRSAIEPMIGHAKNDGRLGRNYLLGTDGDKINALLAAAGHNLRLVLTRLVHRFARFIGALLRLMTKGGQISIAGDPGSVFPNIGLPLPALTNSMA